jgi:acyl-CoA synthetase (AMP-forming)/AMP-acid ligase II
LAAKFEGLSRHVDPGGWRRVLCVLPVNFAHGLITNCLWPWLAGRDLVVLPSGNMEVLGRLGELVDQFEADFLSTVPSIWRWVLHSGVAAPARGTLKRVHCASAPLDGELWERARAWAGAPLANAYGITETASWIAGTEERPDDGLVGRPWGCDIEVRDTTDGAGTVWVRAASLMRGYLGRPDLTAAAVRDGWFRTGDMGYLDAEGRLHLKGRVDDVINKGGLKVFPDELESLLRGCPGVADVCVFAEPHAMFGEAVGAAVVLRGTDLAGVQAWCDERLSSFKVPTAWYELKEIPRNERGKVNRRKLSETCRGSTHG